MTPEQITEIDEAWRPGHASILAQLIKHGAHNLKEHPEPVIVRGCTVIPAASLKEAVRVVWFGVPALLAEVERLTKDRDHWHDTYQADAGARDQLLAELLDALPGDHAEMLDAYAEVLNGVERLVAELTNERRALAAARKGMATLTARWRQQLRDHGDYATRIADNPDLVATYRDTCTKTGVYDRVIGELDGLLKLVAPDEADGGAE